MKFVLACVALSLLSACAMRGANDPVKPSYFLDARQELEVKRPVPNHERNNDGRLGIPRESGRSDY